MDACIMWYIWQRCVCVCVCVCVCPHDNFENLQTFAFCLVLRESEKNLGRVHTSRSQVKVKVILEGSRLKVVNYSVAGSEIPSRWLRVLVFIFHLKWRALIGASWVVFLSGHGWWMLRVWRHVRWPGGHAETNTSKPASRWADGVMGMTVSTPNNFEDLYDSGCGFHNVVDWSPYSGCRAYQFTSSPCRPTDWWDLLYSSSFHGYYTRRWWDLEVTPAAPPCDKCL